MAAVPPTDCVVSTITSYELYTGVEKCSDSAKERAKVGLLLKTIHQAPFDAAAAIEAARIRALLESHGQSIGPYDLLLAGYARALTLVMVSANVNEFRRVPDLIVENWLL
jgi:tRNA(fMet)-specific endonuclease VapC